MVKWKNKTDEEKRETFEKQQAMLGAHREAKEQSTSGDVLGICKGFNAKIDDTEKWKEIWSDGDIPIFCPTCGWVGCSKYTMKFDSMMKGAQKILMVEGHCKVCQRFIRKAVNMLASETMMIMALIPQLTRAGRFEDLREESDEDGTEKILAH